MPRKSRKSRPELDDVVGLPAHIIVLIAAMLLLFVGGVSTSHGKSRLQRPIER